MAEPRATMSRGRLLLETIKKRQECVTDNSVDFTADVKVDVRAKERLMEQMKAKREKILALQRAKENAVKTSVIEIDFKNANNDQDKPLPSNKKEKNLLASDLKENEKERPESNLQSVPSAQLGEVEKSDESSSKTESSSYRGTRGTAISLDTNQVRLIKTGSVTTLYTYHCTFFPHIDSKVVKSRCISKCENVIGKTWFFSGLTLCVPKKLPSNINYLESSYPPAFPEVKISLSSCKEQSYSDHASIALFNNLFRKVLKELKFQSDKGRHFDPQKPIIFPESKLEIWPGYVIRVNELEGGLMLTCDASNRVLRTETVYSLMDDIQQAQRRKSSQNPDYEKYMKSALLGEQILTRYNCKHYTIHDIDFDVNPTCPFETVRGEKLTYIEYYRRQYGIEIGNPEQPLLVNWPKKNLEGDQQFKIHLVPELCYLTGISANMKKDGKLMVRLREHVNCTPEQRRLAMMKFIDNVKENPNCRKILSDWGLEIGDGNLRLEGRKLDDFSLILGNDVKTLASNDFSSELKKNVMFRPVPLNRWLFIYSSKNKDRKDYFIRLFFELCQKRGMRISNPMEKEINSEYPANFVRAIETSNNPELVFALFPSKRADIYAAVKKTCYLKKGIQCQGMLAKNLYGTKATAVLNNIVMQINAKMGGGVWATKSPYFNAMVVGIDVYHNLPKSHNSWLGLVASLNATFTRWASFPIQHDGQHLEISSKIGVLFTKALNQYYNVNACLPDRIIIYRDGVGDGDLETCRNIELEQIKRAFIDFKEYNPPVTFIIVSKRINTRIFEINKNGRYSNPPVGTVLDHTVTKKHLFDFFLISQRASQGTVSPTHYIVLEDNINMGPDKAQIFTYRLCYMYCNWAGPVGVPAPCLYAHKLAGLYGEYLQNERNKMDSTTLYQL